MSPPTPDELVRAEGRHPTNRPSRAGDSGAIDVDAFHARWTAARGSNRRSLRHALRMSLYGALLARRSRTSREHALPDPRREGGDAGRGWARDLAPTPSRIPRVGTSEATDQERQDESANRRARTSRRTPKSKAPDRLPRLRDGDARSPCLAGLRAVRAGAGPVQLPRSRG